jgi:hypothetical protein
MKITGGRSVSSLLIVVLNIARYALGIVLVATVAFVGLALVADIRGLELSVLPPEFGVSPDVHTNWRITIPVLVGLDEPRAASASLRVDDAHIEGLRGSLSFPVRRGGFFLLNALVLMSAIGLALWVVTELRAVLRTVRDGHPFVAANAGRVRRIAYAVIVGEFARAAIVYFENSYAMTHFSAEGLRFAARADFSVAAIIEGLIILVIAQVFRTGTRLDEEQSLTV